MENLLTIFIVVTAAAVVLQAGILVALFLTFKKAVDTALPSIQSMNQMVTDLRPKVEQIAENVVLLQPKIIPIVDAMVEARPKVEKIVENLVETTNQVRSEVQRVDATVNDLVDRARLQVIRADEMLTRTFDRVEHTSDVVAKTVVSPVRQVSGIVRGVSAGLEFFLSNRGRKNGGSRGARCPVPQDEMFI
jgi:methyl-accepting chemotaxis protein